MRAVDDLYFIPKNEVLERTETLRDCIDGFASRCDEVMVMEDPVNDGLYVKVKTRDDEEIK